MKKEVLKRIFVVFSLVTIMIVALPFHMLYADDSVTISTSNILGCMITNGSEDSMISCVMDNNYIGTFYAKFNAYTTNNTSVTTAEVKMAVNGSIAYGNTQTPNIQHIRSVNSITSQSISILTTHDGEQQFPIESFPIINQISGRGYSLVALPKIGYYTYPVYDVPSNSVISENYSNANNPDKQTIIYIFGTDKLIYDLTTFNNNFSFTHTNSSDIIEYEYVETLYRTDIVNPFSIFKVKCKCTNSGSSRIQLITDTHRQIMPIFVGYDSQDNFSTDFALEYNLTNKLLKAIENITPTVSSDNSASDLENEQSDFSSSAADLYSYENTFNNNMNTALNNVNVNFDVGNQLGSKFLASATWVRQQFDSLTNNTPFGTVLSFSLILGIALLIIGKAVK